MASQKWGDLCGDLYRFCARFVRLARIEENRKSSIYPLIFRLFSNRGHVAEWLRSGLQNPHPPELCHRRSPVSTATSRILLLVPSAQCAAFCATPRTIAEPAVISSDNL